MRSRAGFTLVELIAALVIVGLIAAIVAGTLRLGVRAQERLLARTEAMEDRRVVLGQLRRYLEGAEPLLLPASPEARIAFQGDATQLWFAAEMAGGDGGGGLWLARLAIVPGGGGLALALHRRPLVEGGGFVPLKEDEQGILLDSLKGARLAYSDGKEWRDDWNDPWLLPAKIRLRLESADETAWPELIVAPAARRVRR